MRAKIRKLALPVVFLVVALPVGIGTVMAMGDHKQTHDESRVQPISPGSHARFERRAQPRCERLATLSGDGPAARSFAIAARANQWRADWSCSSGDFRRGNGSLG